MKLYDEKGKLKKKSECRISIERLKKAARPGNEVEIKALLLDPKCRP